MPQAASVSAHSNLDAEVQVFRLYISVASQASSRALVNARRLFEQHLAGRYTLEIIDLADAAEAAQRDQVIASPTLIRLSPLPQRRFIGDMSDPTRLLQMMGAPRQE